MKMTYDVRGDVLYIILRKEVETDVDRTIQVNDYVLVDVDAQGRPLGIEVLNAQRLAGDESVTEVDVELLRNRAKTTYPFVGRWVMMSVWNK